MKKKIKYALNELSMFIILVTSCTTLAQEEKIYYIHGDIAHIRNHPSMHSPIIGNAPINTRIRILKNKNEWYLCTIGEIRGWIHNSIIGTSPLTQAFILKQIKNLEDLNIKRKWAERLVQGYPSIDTHWNLLKSILIELKDSRGVFTINQMIKTRNHNKKRAYLYKPNLGYENGTVKNLHFIDSLYFLIVNGTQSSLRKGSIKLIKDLPEEYTTIQISTNDTVHFLLPSLDRFKNTHLFTSFIGYHDFNSQKRPLLLQDPTGKDLLFFKDTLSTAEESLIELLLTDSHKEKVQRLFTNKKTHNRNSTLPLEAYLEKNSFKYYALRWAGDLDLCWFTGNRKMCSMFLV